MEHRALGQDATLGDVVRTALRDAAEQYRMHEALLRANDDVETVHKARVAVRKLRSLLRSFACFLDSEWSSDLRERLRAAQDALAAVRDADVFVERLESSRDSLPPEDLGGAAETLERARGEAREQHARLRGLLDDENYQTASRAIIHVEESPRFRAECEELPALHAVRAVMRRALKSLRKAALEAEEHRTDRALHGVRIKAKHLRYACEAFTPLCPAASAYARRVERLQTCLGTQHDGAVSIIRLRALEGSRRASFAAGEFALLAHFEKARAGRRWYRLWRKLCRKKNRFW